MIPRATYRLQFNAALTFADAARLAPYLAALGASHLYASPWLQARAGSEHGYDITDHASFNVELGGEAGFEALHAALAANGLGHILDFVPNHMGIAEAGNAWWQDVLAWGRASPYADWFDIDWAPPDRDLRNKVLLPFLGDHYGAVLERGELVPRFDRERGAFSICYFDHRFPLSSASHAVPIRAAAALAPAFAPRLELFAEAARQLRVRAGTTAQAAQRVREQAALFHARLAAESGLHDALERGAASLLPATGAPESARPLHLLLERQAYRLAYWRVATNEINYRRFFDINDLAGLRVENRRVFARLHTLVARLLSEGKLDGLRIDHLDGLVDPAQYCRRLRRLVPRPFYLVVEKILEGDEALRAGWPVAGTTGYDFLNQVNGLLVDRRNEAAFTRTFERFTGSTVGFDEVLHAAKLQIMHSSLASELQVLARQLHRLARRHWRTRDYTLDALGRALAQVVAALPVYRTYVDARGADPDDRRVIEQALAGARRHRDVAADDIFDFIGAAMTGDLAGIPRYGERAVLRFAMKLQQYTSPVMAKGLEDTALYRWHRLDGLNEVGGDPRRFGLSIAGFHDAIRRRALHWPHAMLATATHDAKRGEDLRARLAALTQLPREWSRAVAQWARLNRSLKRTAGGTAAPARADEYMLYQTLLAAWPVDLEGDRPDAAALAAFATRIGDYLRKAIREAKLHSSWADPDDDYEQAAVDFAGALLDPDTGWAFREAFLPLQRRVAELGVDASLVQLVLKLTCPGVPDLYQGCETWDLSLVDPDNRRPVDFAARAELLARVQAWSALPPGEQVRQVEAWREGWQDGAIKMHVLHRLLRLRATEPALFAEGGYRPLEARNGTARLIAFERRYQGRRIVVAACLRRAQPGTAGGSVSADPASDGSAPRAWTDVLSGRSFAAAGALDADSLFASLPVAVLAPAPATTRLAGQAPKAARHQA